MDINFLKPFEGVDYISTPSNNRKKTCILFLGENISLKDAIFKLKFKVDGIKSIFIPTLRKPTKTKATPSYAKDLTTYGYNVLTGSVSDNNLKFTDNIIMDSTPFMEKNTSKYNTIENSKKSLSVTNSLMVELGSIRKEFEKVIIYTVDGNLPEDITKSRFYPLFITILRNRYNPNYIVFDKVIIFNNNSYTLIYSKKNSNVDMDKIREYFKMNNKLKSNFYDDDDGGGSFVSKINEFRKKREENRQRYLNQFKKNEVKEGVIQMIKPAVKYVAGGVGTGAALGGAFRYTLGNGEEEIKQKTAQVAQNTNDLQQMAGTAPEDLSSKALRYGGLAAGTAAIGAAGGIALASKISDIMQKRNWQKKGCQSMKDPNRKRQCEIYIKNKTIQDLKRQETQCKDDICKSKIQQKIQGLL